MNEFEMDLATRGQRKCFSCLQKNRKLGRTSDQRRAMLRAMVTYLLENGQIKTTITRAKEVAPVAEKMITLAKKNDLASYRQALGFITKEDVAKKLFQELGPKFMLSATAVTPALSASAPPRRCRRDGDHPAGVIPHQSYQDPGPGGPGSFRRGETGFRTAAVRRKKGPPASPAVLLPDGRGAPLSVSGSPGRGDAAK